jgi:hypothetical protein
MGPAGRGKFAHEELGEPDAYFVNDGQGRFTPVSFTSGTFLDEDGRPLTAPPFDWDLSVLFRDLDGDGAPDLHLCHDFSTPDRLWYNDGQGRFRLAPLVALRQTSLASMAVDAADLDRDGYDDLFLSQNFFGVEMDTARYDAGRGRWLRGDGRGGLTPVRGQDCGVLVYGEQRGAAVADFDADGRVDSAVTQNRAETKLYRNAGAKAGVRLQLAGPPGNPFGIGAVMWLRSGDRSGPAREVRAGSGYWSQDSPVQVPGLAGTPSAVEVRWPGGRVTTSALPAGVREIKVRAGAESEVIP